MDTEIITLNDRAGAPSAGRFVNSGEGPALVPIDIGHPEYFGVIEPDTAFWSLVRREQLADVLSGGKLPGGKLLEGYAAKSAEFAVEMDTLRFGLKPSAVYFNPTDRCNLNCPYCYIPAEARGGGAHMSKERLIEALRLLRDYFRRTLGEGDMPQIIFHGAEPMLNREAVFAGIEEFAGEFRFGIQTNATLLDDSAVRFLTDRRISIGVSLDAPTSKVGDLTRRDWEGRGVHASVLSAMERLNGYDRWSVISTITAANMAHLTQLVEFLHAQEVPTALMNIIRCTLPKSLEIKPDDAGAAAHFIAALERTRELYQETGRKLPIANFANILLAIIAPTARRLMCDISPCGGGRCFFALSANGDLFPCSEFIGLGDFRGGNIFEGGVDEALASAPFGRVTGRRVEDIEPCNRCAIRHFCGSPCPAEAAETCGGMDRTGAFCEFYEEQVRYAFRLIADGAEDAFLWDGWDKGTRDTFDMALIHG